MYNHGEIESKWQKYWSEHDTFACTNPELENSHKPKFYALDMFPYPSGAGLHVGHPKGYTATDIIARYKHAKGFHVLHPMGWDAFGLPAENYAIKTGTHPAITTAANIERFREQLKKFGFSFDWNREVDTTSPGYYKWSQWIFLKLFEAGLAYESDKPINFCPSCKTGLANEEVVDGKCERCGTPVEKKAIRQWILAITKYADRLLSDIDRLDWPKGIKEMQRNWIGRSEGVNFKNKVKDMNITFENYNSVPQTYHAETFTAIAPEHALVYELVKGTPQEKEVMDFCEKIKAKKAAGKFDFEKDLEGIFTGRYVENFAGTGNNLPIWVASYILADYGTGIVNCSAHDVRDFAFAKKHDIPLHPVMFPADSVEAEKVRNLEYSYAKDDEGIMEEPALFKGRKWGEVREDIIDHLDKNGFAERKINYKLRDWIFSRQRYWGEPIPLIHIKDEDKESLSITKNDDCWVDGDMLKKGDKTLGKITRGISDWLLPDWDLPLKLPEVEKYEPSGDGESPLATIPAWVHVQLGKNLSGYRETNTMPQWAGSCWYYLRFMDPTNSDAIVDPAVVKYWGEVDSYIGGAEHAVLHLLYARFWHKFLFDIGVVPTDEPFFRLRNVGLILGPDGNKMSKSKGNVINPDDVISEYGADTLRLYEMSMADFSDVAPWNTKAIVGSYRLLEKIYRLFTTGTETTEYKSWTTDDNLRAAKTMHKTIKKVGEDIENMKFNTAIAAINIMVNEGIPTDPEQAHEWKSVVARLLQPFAPHMAEECWSLMGNEDSIYSTEWPEYIPAMTIDDEVQIAIQIGGKLRGTYPFLRGVTAEEVRMTVENKPEIAKWLEGVTVIKEVFIPNKILNIVVK
ncbi:leucine--tRNA ligase [Candidatus Gracilibacteria bacterium]|nr:leucine--tRNA ligase [Candidatus Gracilibacteria bacterium]